MKTKILKYPEMAVNQTSPIVLAAGFFDGVHLGHQNVIQTAVRLAKNKNLPAAVLTFDRHPSLVFGAKHEYSYLTPLNTKLDLFDQLGVDIVYIAEFNEEFIQLSPQSFVEEFLLKLNLNTLVAGYDWTYGKKEIATMDLLFDLANNQFEIYQVPKLELAEQKISSTNIRTSLATGKVQTANLLLNRNYQNSGVVVKGVQMGRKLGYPTANLQIPAEQFLPRIGVYVTRVLVDGQWYPAMTSIGHNVTFERGDNPLTVEANLLDFDADLYGQTLAIEWLKYLRDEQKFADVEGLIAQLEIDQQNTEKYFFKK